ncbi:MAG TPA: lytic transglycosylase domain-containing protein [Baekduia sp.]|nr:lytic transglycosylase domain-containing protein [Baekduia sp.]
MSIALVDARIAGIQQQFAAFTGQTSAANAATAASFAAQLASAQAAGTTPSTATTTATGTTLGGGSPTRYDAQIAAAATRYGLDPALLKGLIRQESNFDAAARSGAGAQGLTQLMPATAASLGVDAGDPAQAIDGGARYLKQQLDRFGGDASKALAAYNAGPGAVAKYGGIPPYAETQNYVQKVLGYAAEYRGSAAAGTAATVPAATTPVSAASLLATAGADTAPSGSLDYSTI